MLDLFNVAGERFDLNVPITKYNESTGEFEAWATVEQLDKSGEIIDIDKSFPYFEAHSRKFSEATGGQSFGNVREQHDPKKAAGKLIAPPEIRNHESGVRGVYVKGVAVDPLTKEKLASRVLVGVSIGGRYIGEAEKVTIGGHEARKYTADPSEYSLVDNPCVPDALITVVKADGSQSTQKAVGFNPPQGFQCRAAQFHVKKEDARKCESDHSEPVEKVIEKGIIEGAPKEDDFKKSLYGIARLSTILADLMSARSDAEFEAAYDIVAGEPPNSEVKDRLTDAAQSVFDALEAIIADERAELETAAAATNPAAEAVTDYAPVFEMSSLIGALKKSATAKQLIKSLHVHTGNESSSTSITKEDTMSDTKKEEKAAPVEKIEEQKPAEKSADNGELSKAATDQIAKAVESGLSKALEPISTKVDAIEKAHDATKADIERITKTVKAIIDRVAPPKAMKRVTKAEDGKEEAADHGKQKNVEKTSLDLMNDALDAPRMVQFGRLSPAE